MVQTFTANRTDDAFDVSSLPRRPRGAEHFFDIHCRDLVAELLAIDSISISQQISRRGIKRKGFEHLLRRPFGRRVSRNVEVHDASSIVCKDNKNEKDFEPNGVDGEEVDGRELRNVIIEEGPPRLRWGFGASDHVLGNRSLRDLNVQLHQLALDPGCAPNRVVAAHGSNQIADLFRNLRPSGLSVPHLPSPIPTKSLTMPADDGFRHDDDKGRTPSRPQPRQPNPKTSVAWFEDWSLVWVRWSTV